MLQQQDIHSKMSDDEVLEQQRLDFEVLEDLAMAVTNGNMRSLIVTGPPGVGKSHTVNEVLKKANLCQVMGAGKTNYQVVKGVMSNLSLYTTLYKNKKKGRVILFDDCDSVLTDPLSLNLLKSALDTSDPRSISWESNTKLLEKQDVPRSFDFNGGVIMISNLDFTHNKTQNSLGTTTRSKIQNHWEALKSRSFIMHLSMGGERGKVLRIRDVVNSKKILDAYKFEGNEAAEVMKFFEDNYSNFGELSIRTILKLADVRKSLPLRWEAVVRRSLFTINAS